MPHPKKIKLTDEQYKAAEECYAFGVCKQPFVAHQMGISEDTFIRIRDTDKDKRLNTIINTARARTSLNFNKAVAYEAMKQSREVEKEIVTVYVDPKGKELSRSVENKVVKKKTTPSVRAMQLWGTTQEGWIKTERHEHTGKDGAKVQVEITLDEVQKQIAELEKSTK